MLGQSSEEGGCRGEADAEKVVLEEENPRAPRNGRDLNVSEV